MHSEKTGSDMLSAEKTENNIHEMRRLHHRVFEPQNINLLFGYLGGYNVDIVDAFCRKPENRFILNYHEQAAAFAINAMATVSGEIAVMTTSGAPSTCNSICGVANAYFDSHPCVFLVGCTHSMVLRTSPEIRQNGFEEIDIVQMVSGISKYAVRLQKPEDIRYELEKAFYLAAEGRKGPVVLDIPYNFARAEIGDPEMLKSFVEPPATRYQEIDYRKVIAMLRQATRPVLMLGGGSTGKESRRQLRALLEKIELPVVATMCGLDTLAHDHPCFCGFIGHYGNRYANLAIGNTDFLLVLGARLEERQLGGYLTKLPAGAKLVRVEIEQAELNRKLPETMSIHSSVENFLTGLLANIPERLMFPNWLACINLWRQRYPACRGGELTSNDVVRKITSLLPPDGVVCADVGQNQMSTAQASDLSGDRRIVNSASYASMGYSLPAAIGAAYARPNSRIVSFNGDGGIQMNIQELQTVVREKLPIIIVVLNNSCLGMIRRLQEKLYDNRTYVSVDGYSVPDFGAVSKAYKIPFLRIERVDQLDKIEEFISTPGPCFIEVTFPVELENNPEPGRVIDQQTPLLSPAEVEQIRRECQQP